MTMAVFRYRGTTATGEIRQGAIEAPGRDAALARVRGLGLTPIEATEVTGKPEARSSGGGVRLNAAGRQAVANALGELSVLLGAGLTLDRALTVCTENIQRPDLVTAFEAMGRKVKEGAPLSRAMVESPGLFPQMASAMAESGEANGRLDSALARLAETLDRAEALRQTISSAMVYPILLMTVAVGVILMMLLFVIPQFEDLFEGAGAQLPFMSRMVMAASQGLRAHGLVGLAVLAAAGFALNHWLRRPAIADVVDRLVLELPQLGRTIKEAETARFARVLGSLVDGGVPLPQALSIARRSIGNRHMGAAVARVAASLKEGGGLTRPLAATGVFPPMALSFLRTGEETAQFGLMLTRLADVLDRNVRTAVERLVTILTPAITVMMAAMVATVIAAIMSAILGFNDLALAP